MNITKVRLIRRIYLSSSLSLGVLTPLVCWYLLPSFNPITEPLSYFGVAESTLWYWNTSLLLIAIGLYINASKALSLCVYDKLYDTILKALMAFFFTALCLTAVFSMNYSLIHKVSAVSFFLIYNLFVFLFGLFRSLKYVRKGLFSIAIGSLMLLSSLLLIPFPSYGVFEIVYFVLVLYWNAVLFKKRMRKEDRVKS